MAARFLCLVLLFIGNVSALKRKWNTGNYAWKQDVCDCTVTYPGPSEAACGGASKASDFMVLLENSLRKDCEIEDPCGQIRPRQEPDDEYDFIVVGLGSAGAVVANRLSEIGSWKVLGVEAGGNEPTSQQVPSLYTNMPGTNVDWQFKTEPEEGACLRTGGVCTWPRGKVCGGTSVMNGMYYVRGSHKDFDQWKESGCIGWGYKDVLPYFLKSENNLQLDKMDRGYHQKGGYLSVTQFPYHHPISEDMVKAGKELGYEERDVNGEKLTGFAIVQSTTRGGIRQSTCRAFLRPIQTRKNLHILLKSTATRVLVDQKTKRAYGVEVLLPEGETKQIIAKKEVIISGGAVNSPQILLLSGIGNKEDIARVNGSLVHHLPGVGKNLQNHVSYDLSFELNEPDVIGLNSEVEKEYLLYKTGPMSSVGTPVVAFINSKYANKSEDNPDLRMFFDAYSASCGKTGKVGEINGELINGSPPKRVVRMGAGLTHPKSRGYITLKDNNPLSHPKIVPNYLTVRDDIDRLIDGTKITLKLSKTKALQKHGYSLIEKPTKGCESLTFASDEYWECAIRHDMYRGDHQSGTCKMGPATDPEAVVDPELKVHGIKSLRVMDASIMPIVTSGNTNAPTIMIAEKGSNIIKKTWLVDQGDYQLP